MDAITRLYPKDIAISIESFSLDETLKRHLLQEFTDKPFVVEELNKLLQLSSYHQIQKEGITLNYLPVNYLSTALIKKVFRRILTLKYIYRLNETISIWFIPLSLKRCFPQKGERISAKHINGGYTYLHNNTIYIYRYEEFPKVILHEVLHHTKLQTEWTSKQWMRLYDFLGIDSTQCPTNCQTVLQPSEAIIEAWAIYYQCMFLAYEKQQSFQTFYQQELEWSLYQTRRLLKYHQKYFSKGWKEDTHAYSYIVLKTCIWYYWDTFSKIKTPYNDRKMTDFFIQHLSESNFQKAIQDSKTYRSKSFCMTRLGQY